MMEFGKAEEVGSSDKDELKKEAKKAMLQRFEERKGRRAVINARCCTFPRDNDSNTQ